MIPSPEILGFYDFDNDGDRDAFCHREGTNVSTLGLGWIEQESPDHFATFHGISALFPQYKNIRMEMTEVNDVDNDGDLDIITQSGTNDNFYSQLVVCFNNGSGEFLVQSTQDSYGEFVLANLDGDLVNEIYTTKDLHIIRFDVIENALLSDTVFTLEVNQQGDKLTQLASGDANNDGVYEFYFLLTEEDNESSLFDVIFSVTNTNEIIWEATPVLIPTWDGDWSYETEMDYFDLSDINSDGFIDLITSGLPIDEIYERNFIRLNNGTGSFPEPCNPDDVFFDFNSSFNREVNFGGNDEREFFYFDIDREQNFATANLLRGLACGANPENETGYLPVIDDYNMDGYFDLFRPVNEDGYSGKELVIVDHGNNMGEFLEGADTLFIHTPYFSLVGFPNMRLGDFDNNGTTDLLNLGDGRAQCNANAEGLIQATKLPEPEHLSGPVTFKLVADINQDGSDDLIFIGTDNLATNRDIYACLSVNGLISNEEIMVYDNQNSASNYRAKAFNVSDIDLDGDMDILVDYRSLGNGTVSVIKNNGNMQFSEPQSLFSDGFSGFETCDLSVFDHGNDGDEDIYLYGRLYTNNGLGQYTFTTGTGLICTTCLLEDINGDGNTDIVGSIYGIGDSIRVHLNNGNFAFTPIFTISPYDFVYEPFAFDFNEDGLPEIVHEKKIYQYNGTSMEIPEGLQGLNLPVFIAATRFENNPPVIYFYNNGYYLSRDFVGEYFLCTDPPEITITQSNGALILPEEGTNFHWYDCTTQLMVDGANGNQIEPSTEGSYYATFNLGNCDIQTPCQNYVVLFGDINGDGVLDAFDLDGLLANFGCVGDCIGDLDEDGIVSILDFQFFIGLWQ